MPASSGPPPNRFTRCQSCRKLGVIRLHLFQRLVVLSPLILEGPIQHRKIVCSLNQGRRVRPRPTYRFARVPTNARKPLNPEQPFCFALLRFTISVRKKKTAPRCSQKKPKYCNFCTAKHTFPAVLKLQFQCKTCTDNAQFRSTAKKRMLVLQ